MLRSLVLLALVHASFVLMGSAHFAAAQSFDLPGTGAGATEFKPRARQPSSQARSAQPSAAARPAPSNNQPPFRNPNPNTATSRLGGNPAGSANAANRTVTAGRPSGGGELPNGHGQFMHTYDLSPYTGHLSKMDHPQQAIVDWVLRETGSDAWFNEPFGFMSASRDKLSVYHTPEMQRVVAGVVDRFIAGDLSPQVLNLKVMTVGNPNWRTRAHVLMQHVTVDSPGVQAWLLTKENAAVVMSQLRARTDTRQVQAIDLITHNGQTEKLTSTRGRNYIRNVRPATQGWPPYQPETGEVQEGYKLEISPLLATDGQAIDCVIKASIDQVDKLVPVDLDLPLPNAQTHRGRIDVPQVVSWRLHERFRWPSDMVLLLSCGVVASPERTQSAIPLLNTNMFTGTTAGRADALMFVEFRGRASENLTTTPLTPQIATQPGTSTRGRY